MSEPGHVQGISVHCSLSVTITFSVTLSVSHTEPLALSPLPVIITYYYINLFGFLYTVPSPCFYMFRKYEEFL